MSHSTVHPPQQSKLVRLLVIASSVWGLLVLVFFFLLTSGILDWLFGAVAPSTVPPLDILVGMSQGFLVVAGVIVVVHAFALFVARTSSWGLALAIAAMLFTSFVTGFTVGLYLLPCALLLLVALLAKSSPRSAG